MRECCLRAPRGREREVQGLLLGTQAFSMSTAWKGRVTVHTGSTPSPSCPSSCAVNLSATPKDTCAQGSCKAAAPNTGPGGEPGSLRVGLRPSRNGLSSSSGPRRPRSFPLSQHVLCDLPLPIPVLTSKPKSESVQSPAWVRDQPWP